MEPLVTTLPRAANTHSKEPVLSIVVTRKDVKSYDCLLLLLDSRFALAQTIGRVLVNMKIAQDTEPTTFSQEEVDKYYNGVSPQVSFYAGSRD
jgi:hypothetical protein